MTNGQRLTSGQTSTLHRHVYSSHSDWPTDRIFQHPTTCRLNDKEIPTDDLRGCIAAVICEQPSHETPNSTASVWSPALRLSLHPTSHWALSQRNRNESVETSYRSSIESQMQKSRHKQLLDVPWRVSMLCIPRSVMQANWMQGKAWWLHNKVGPLKPRCLETAAV